MSVLRQQNWLDQQRIDIPHLRALESSIAADFDVVVGRMVTGGTPVVVRGFTMSASGSSPSALQLYVADGIVANLDATESGSFLWVSPDRTTETLDPAANTRLVGSWTPGVVNFVGLDVVRRADTSTMDTVQFKNLTSGLDQPRVVPLARTLDYRIVVSPIPFSAQPNLVPLAKVTLDASGLIATAATDLVDARTMLFRLGTGGDVPTATAVSGWPQGRTESGFAGGDKGFASQKDWMDGVMTRIWELGGGQRWYSPTADRNVHVVPMGTISATTGDYYSWPVPAPAPGNAGALTWGKLRILLDNSTATYNVVNANSSPGLDLVADGDCLYVDLDRDVPGKVLTPAVANLSSLGVGPRPGSRYVLAWRVDDVTTSYVYTRDWRYPVGTTFTPARTDVQGVVKIARAATNVNDPIVIGTTGGSIANDSVGTAALAITNTTGPALTVSGRSSVVVNTGAFAALTIGNTGGQGLSVTGTTSSYFGGGLDVGGRLTATHTDAALASITATNNGSGAGIAAYSDTGKGMDINGATASTVTGGLTVTGVSTFNTATTFGEGATINRATAGTPALVINSAATPSGVAAATGLTVQGKSIAASPLLAVLDSGGAGKSLSIVRSASVATESALTASNDNGPAAVLVGTLPVQIASTSGTALALTGSGTTDTQFVAGTGFQYSAAQTKYLFIAPSEFTGDGATFTTDAGGRPFFIGTATGNMFAKVQLPPGAVVQTISMGYSVTAGPGAAGALTANLVQMTQLPTTTTVDGDGPWSVSATATTANPYVATGTQRGWTTEVATALTLDPVTQAQMLLAKIVVGNHATVRFYGLRIKYTIQNCIPGVA